MTLLTISVGNSEVHIHYMEQHYQCEINQKNVETHIAHIPFDGATFGRSVMISHEESKSLQ